MTTISELRAIETMWRKTLIEKGYKSITVKFTYEGANDEFKVELWWFTEDWATQEPPKELRRSSAGGVEICLIGLTNYINQLPMEHIARDQALLRDYARIKERIDKSHLADRLKAAAQALMDAMSTNILPPPDK